MSTIANAASVTAGDATAAANPQSDADPSSLYAIEQLKKLVLSAFECSATSLTHTAATVTNVSLNSPTAAIIASTASAPANTNNAPSITLAASNTNNTPASSTSVSLAEFSDSLELAWRDCEKKYAAALQQFLHRADIRQLFFFVPQSASAAAQSHHNATNVLGTTSSPSPFHHPSRLGVHFSHPPSSRIQPGSRLVWVMKQPHTSNVTVENLPGSVLVGDMPASDPLDGLCELVETLYGPFLLHPSNHVGIPSVLSADLIEHFHSFRTSLLTKNSMEKNGVALLPMPPESVLKAAEIDIGMISLAANSFTTRELDELTTTSVAAVKLLEKLVACWLVQVQQITSTTGASSSGGAAGTDLRHLDQDHYYQAGNTHRGSAKDAREEEKTQTMTNNSTAPASSSSSIPRDASVPSHPNYSRLAQRPAGPLSELQYWQMRLQQLEHVSEQISTSSFQRVVNVFKKQSAFPAVSENLHSIVSRVAASKEEARANSRSLEPLRPFLQKLSHARESTTDFLALPQVLPPILRLIELIWYDDKSGSTVGSHPAKIGLLWRRLSDAFLEQCVDYIHDENQALGGADLQKASNNVSGITTGDGSRKAAAARSTTAFHNEYFNDSSSSLDSLEKLNLIDQMIEYFWSLIAAHKKKLQQGNHSARSGNANDAAAGAASTAAKSSKIFAMSNVIQSELFSRLQYFHLQIRTLIYIADSIRLFQHLPRLEIAGKKGKILAVVFNDMYMAFQRQLKRFSNHKNYPLIHPDFHVEFTRDATRFLGELERSKREFSSIVAHAFRDCATEEESVNLLDVLVCFLQAYAPAYSQKDMQKRTQTNSILLSATLSNYAMSRTGVNTTGSTKDSSVSVSPSMLSGFDRILLLLHPSTGLNAIYQTLQDTYMQLLHNFQSKELNDIQTLFVQQRDLFQFMPHIAPAPLPSPGSKLGSPVRTRRELSLIVAQDSSQSHSRGNSASAHNDSNHPSSPLGSDLLVYDNLPHYSKMIFTMRTLLHRISKHHAQLQRLYRPLFPNSTIPLPPTALNFNHFSATSAVSSNAGGSLYDAVSHPLTSASSTDSAATATPLSSTAEEDEYQSMQHAFDFIVANMKEYISKKHQEWVQQVSAAGAAKLDQYLLTRNEKGHLVVNLDFALVELLREVKYLSLIGLSIPETAAKIYLQIDLFRNYTGILDLIIYKYNSICSNLVPVEQKLLQHRLDEIDAQLIRGLESLTWQSKGVLEYLNKILGEVNSLYVTMEKIKALLKKIEGIVHGWSEVPLLVPNENEPINLDVSLGLVRKRIVQDLNKDGKLIHDLVDQLCVVFGYSTPGLHNMSLLSPSGSLNPNNPAAMSSGSLSTASPHMSSSSATTSAAGPRNFSRKSPQWRAYLEYIDNDIIAEGFIKLLTTSLQYLYDLMSTATAMRTKRIERRGSFERTNSGSNLSAGNAGSAQPTSTSNNATSAAAAGASSSSTSASNTSTSGKSFIEVLLILDLDSTVNGLVFDPALVSEESLMTFSSDSQPAPPPPQHAPSLSNRQQTMLVRERRASLVSRAKGQTLLPSERPALISSLSAGSAAAVSNSFSGSAVAGTNATTAAPSLTAWFHALLALFIDAGGAVKRLSSVAAEAFGESNMNSVLNSPTLSRLESRRTSLAPNVAISLGSGITMSMDAAQQQPQPTPVDYRSLLENHTVISMLRSQILESLQVAIQQCYEFQEEHFHATAHAQEQQKLIVQAVTEAHQDMLKDAVGTSSGASAGLGLTVNPNAPLGAAPTAAPTTAVAAASSGSYDFYFYWEVDRTKFLSLFHKYGLRTREKLMREQELERWNRAVDASKQEVNKLNQMLQDDPLPVSPDGSKQDSKKAVSFPDASGSSTPASSIHSPYSISASGLNSAAMTPHARARKAQLQAQLLEEFEREISSAPAPTLLSYDAQLAEFQHHIQALTDMPTLVKLGPFQLNLKQLRSEGMNLLSKWSMSFKTYLHDTLLTGLKDIHTFLDSTETGITLTNPQNQNFEDDYDVLVSIMRHLQRFEAEQDSFLLKKPYLQQLLVILRKYQVEVDDETQNAFETLPAAFEKVSNKSDEVSVMLLPQQEIQIDRWSNQSDSLKKLIISKFAKEWANLAPVKYAVGGGSGVVSTSANANPAAASANAKDLKMDASSNLNSASGERPLQLVNTSFNQLDLLSSKLAELEAEAKKIHEAETLFRVNPKSDFTSLTNYREEIDLLRALWSCIENVETEIEQIEKTKWTFHPSLTLGSSHAPNAQNAIVVPTTIVAADSSAPAVKPGVNINEMESSINSLINKLKRLDKRIQTSYPAFTSALSRATTFKRALPLLSKLQSESMRLRHWKEVTVVTGIKMSAIFGVEFAMAAANAGGAVVGVHALQDSQTKGSAISARHSLRRSETFSAALVNMNLNTASTTTSINLSTIGSGVTVGDLFALNLHKYSKEVYEIVEKSIKEFQIETQLNNLDRIWSKECKMKFEWYGEKRADTDTSKRATIDVNAPAPVPTSNQDLTPILSNTGSLFDTLEEHNLLIQGILLGKHNAFFFDKIRHWQVTLNLVESILVRWLDVQRTWQHLESIFLSSEDIRIQLPAITSKFDSIHVRFRKLQWDSLPISNVIDSCSRPSINGLLDEFQSELNLCEKALNEYLETKRMAFPRFYFVARTDLLDILSKASKPRQVVKHLPKIFGSIQSLLFRVDQFEAGTKEHDEALAADAKAGAEMEEKKKTLFARVPSGTAATSNASSSSVVTPTVPPVAMSKSDYLYAIGLVSVEGEKLMFDSPLLIGGAVENWLNALMGRVNVTLVKMLLSASNSYKAQVTRDVLVLQYCTQIGALACEVAWSSEVVTALGAMEDGHVSALKEYNASQAARLELLIKLIRGNLAPLDLAKVTSLITVDVHQRDVVTELIEQNVENATNFLWQRQLRLSYDTKNKDEKMQQMIIGTCCNASFPYSYEYLGNSGRLVITPLTDRCYITLTQAIKLCMGGAPAGPAGTGKTETVKDLGKSLGHYVYVFNASEQMDHISLGANFKGLAQSGSWGCFDEMNRVSVDVLSVVSTQLRTIYNAIRAKEASAMFEGVKIKINPSCAVFITMNPGYAGRTELPQSLKSLFRSVVMVTPDLVFIAENILLSQGFSTARVLAKKCVTLFKLSHDLVSKQTHYDWGLRALKSTLSAAGAMKRSQSQLAASIAGYRALSESDLMMRVLHDFTISKIVASDQAVFLGLLRDLFPGQSLDQEDDAAKRSLAVQAAEKLSLQPTEQFIHKVLQLQEVLSIRQSVFIIGASCAGKSAVWKTYAAMQNMNSSTHMRFLNPKAMSSDELYGSFVNQEWNDGILSEAMRYLSSFSDDEPRSLVLDGDVDPEWIESLNSVMDDNKVLTLASNERIVLRPSMRLIFEVGNLNYATPATVSRAGVLYLNENDIGWQPYVDSWIARLPQQFAQMRVPLQKMLVKYLMQTVAQFQQGGAGGTSKFKLQVKNQNVFNLVKSTLRLLEALMNRFEHLFVQHPHAHPEHVVVEGKPVVPHPPSAPKPPAAAASAASSSNTTSSGATAPTPPSPAHLLEMYLIFSVIWAFGGALEEDDENGDYRLEFSQWWDVTFHHVRFPERGMVFDYYVDETKGTWSHWQTIIQQLAAPNSASGGNPTSPMTVLRGLGGRKNVLKSGSVDRTKENFQLFGAPTDDEVESATFVYIPTASTIRLTSVAELLTGHIGHPLLFTGYRGVGRSMLTRNVLNYLQHKYNRKNSKIYCNYHTNAHKLQALLESSLERKGGKVFAPIASEHLVYYVDDLNVPRLDAYNTQSSSAVLQFLLDYKGLYDRKKILLHQVNNVQFIANFNPASGSKLIDQRLIGHFSTLSIHHSTQEELTHIYSEIYTRHIGVPSNQTNTTAGLTNVAGAASSNVNAAAHPGFNRLLQEKKVCVGFINGLLELHKRVQALFKPTPSKFHYAWNNKDLSKVMSGLLLASPETLQTPLHLIKLFSHEARRTYRDRLCDDADVAAFYKLELDVIHKNFYAIGAGDERTIDAAIADQAWNHAAFFLEGKHALVKSYQFVSNAPVNKDVQQAHPGMAPANIRLNQMLTQLLKEYNSESNVVPLNLVLFEDAIYHILRINRVLEAPSIAFAADAGVVGGSDGNSLSNGSQLGNNSLNLNAHPRALLLVGVGGSGKQSLVRLASYIAGFDIYMLPTFSNPLKKNGLPISHSLYNSALKDLKESFKELFDSCGLKDNRQLLMLSGSSSSNDLLLEFINDFLFNIDIPYLYTKEEVDERVESIRKEVKEMMIVDTRENCWNYFLGKVRNNLRVAVCFSPVDTNFPEMMRRFPALAGETSMDVFRDWPSQALISVAGQFITEENLPKDAQRSLKGGVNRRRRGSVSSRSRRTQSSASIDASNLSGGGLDLSEPLASEDDIIEENEEDGLSGDALGQFAELSEEVKAERRERELIASKSLYQRVLEYTAFAHASVQASSERYRKEAKRFNYTTPKSFLALISLFESLLHKKKVQMESDIGRLRKGLSKLASTANDVALLQQQISAIQLEVKASMKATSELLEVVMKETEKVDVEREFADKEEKTCSLFRADVAAKKEAVFKDLQAAEPALAAADHALNTLDKKKLGEVMTYKQINEAVVNVFRALLVMIGVVEPGTSRASLSWAFVRAKMGRSDQLMSILKGFKNQIDTFEVRPASMAGVREYTREKTFNKDVVDYTSTAAGNICEFIINIMKYYDIFCNVHPKRVASEQASKQLEEAETRLATVRARVDELNSQLRTLTQQHQKATEEKLRMIGEEKKLRTKLDLAERLLGALANERDRWGVNTKMLEAKQATIIGDVLLAASFVSYCGCFTSNYRAELVHDKWIPWLLRHQIPLDVSSRSGRVDPIQLLISNMQLMDWNNEGLPPDRFSKENGAILTNSERYPLLIDPELQGVTWIKKREQKNGLIVLQAGDGSYLAKLIAGIEQGKPVLIENLNEELDPPLEGIIARNIIQLNSPHHHHPTSPSHRSVVSSSTPVPAPQFIVMVGDKEVSYNPAFRLFLQTRHPNPDYAPEIQAQMSIINFAITFKGLEDQLLTFIANHEMPELEASKNALALQLYQKKQEQVSLEDHLLSKLSNFQGEILEDVNLISELEQTKQTTEEIKAQIKQSTQTTAQLNKGREKYRSLAVRCSMLYYYILKKLRLLNSMYEFSLSSFRTTLLQTLKQVTNESNDQYLVNRINSLIETITWNIFVSTSRGLFECDKLSFVVELGLRILAENKSVSDVHIDFFIRGKNSIVVSPTMSSLSIPKENPFFAWLPQPLWENMLVLFQLDGFDTLFADMDNSPRRFQTWYECSESEKEILPLHYKNLDPFYKLLLIRAIRPDRLTSALQIWIRSCEFLGNKFMEGGASGSNLNLGELCEKEISNDTPCLFLLTPGMDPEKDVAALAKKLNIPDYAPALSHTMTYTSISMGKGQDIVAQQAIDRASKPASEGGVGGWVFLGNTHLALGWLQKLEVQLLSFQINPPHPKFQLFLSAEPPLPGQPSLPLFILQQSVKVTSEARASVLANMESSLKSVSNEVFDSCPNRATEFRGLLFAICFFHSIALGRRRFGAQGWSVPYNFGQADFIASVQILQSYLESPDVDTTPYQHLRYLIGEVIYGGHVTDDWDRRLVSTYLSNWLHSGLFVDVEFAPGFPLPSAALGDRQELVSYIRAKLPAESPKLFGMHRNAEIRFVLKRGEELIANIMDMRFGGSSAAAAEKVEEGAEEDEEEEEEEESEQSQISPATATSELSVSESESKAAEPSSAIASASSSVDILSAAVKLFDSKSKKPNRYQDKEAIATTPILAADESNSREESVKKLVEELSDSICLKSLETDAISVDEQDPFTWVLLSECLAMNGLTAQINRDLKLIDAALKGEVSLTEEINALTTNLYLSRVPKSWAALAYPSLKSLAAWCVDLLARYRQLKDWLSDLVPPPVIWIGGLFQPQSFLTAIIQTAARREQLPLDDMVLITDMTKFNAHEVTMAPTAGCYVSNMFLQGATWIDGSLRTSPPNELFSPLPVCNIRAVSASKAAQYQKNCYQCPVYSTSARGKTFVFTAQLATQADPTQWILNGVAIVLNDD